MGTPSGRQLWQVLESRTTLLHSNADEVPWALKSCLYQLVYGKIGFVICHFA